MEKRKNHCNLRKAVLLCQFVPEKLPLVLAEFRSCRKPHNDSGLMTRQISRRLQNFYSVFANDDQVLIAINADPDAIASAMAVKRLLWRKVAGVTIANINIIERTDNIAMIRLLQVAMTHIDDLDLSKFNRFVIVDSQPSHNKHFLRFSPDVIIDHHPETGCDASYLDIRSKYGANSSIMTEYLRDAKIKPSGKLATGLFLGIKTDTSNFERKTLIEDVNAFHFLFRHANIHLARRIEQAELRPNFLKFFQKAIQKKRFRKGKIFAHLGPVPSADVLVLIADFFMKVEDVNWSIVSGFHNAHLIVIFRNDGIRLHAGTVAKRSFSKLGSAGGHKGLARAEIASKNLRNLVDYQDEKKMLNWLIYQVQKRSAEN